jgi:hypothetical protein
VPGYPEVEIPRQIRPACTVRHLADGEQWRTRALRFVCFKVPAASDRVDRVHIAVSSFAAFSRRSRLNTSIGLVRSLMRTINFSDLGPGDKSGSYLEPAIDGFKPLERVQELEADVSHLIRTQGELLSVLDGKPDAVDSNVRLVRHFELHWRGPSPCSSLDQIKYLFSEFAFHVSCHSDCSLLPSEAT